MKFLYLLFFIFIFFESVAQDRQPVCGTKDDDLPLVIRQQMQNLPELMRARNARKGSEEQMICRVAIEMDSETYLRYNRDTTGMIRDAYESIAQASKVFEREVNVRFVVTSIRIWKDQAADPFNGTDNIFSLLNILANTAPLDVTFDKRTYLFTKNVTGASGVANLGGQLNVSPLGIYSTIMHEFGHNFGSPHTHNCSWPGGPIDYCVSPEGGCYDKSLNQLDNGSLMSYCGSEHSFHPMCQTVMRSHAESVLQKAESAPPKIDALKDMTISKGDFYSWTAVPTSMSYEINYADNQDFQNLVTANSTANHLSTKILSANKDYYIRIRAVNAFGNSAWSDTRLVKVVPKDLGPPDILTQSQGGKIIAPRTGLDLTFSAVEGATDYEVQVVQAFDVGFTNLAASLIVQQTSVYYTPPYGSGYRWRVRPMQGEKRGTWSEVAFFSVNAAKNDRLYIPIPNDLQNVPLSFPFSFQGIGNFSDVTVTVANNAAMANPIFKRTYHYYQLFTGFIKNLPANTKLFFRIEESNFNRSYYPAGNLIDTTIEFTTGNQQLPSNVTFLNDHNQELFGYPNVKAVLTKDNIWLPQPNLGIIKMDQQQLTHELYTRDNTDGLLGLSFWLVMKSDQKQGIHIMTQGTYESFRINDIPNEDPKASSDPFIHYNSITDFDTDAQLFWNYNTIFKKTNGTLSPVKSFQEPQSILQILPRGNKAWILLSNSNGASAEIVVLDLDNYNILETIDYTRNANVKKYIYQMQINKDGHIWLRQYDPSASIGSIAFFDGQQWKVFDDTNSPLGRNLSGLAISPAGDAFVLATGTDAKVFKYNAGNWLQAGSTIPYEYLGNELLVDGKENMWISGIFGYARMTNCPPMDPPLIGDIKSAVDFGEEVKFRITNCPEGQLWSWTNSEGSVKDSLILNEAALTLKLLSNTTFTARCSSKNCAAADTTFMVKVRPMVITSSPNASIPEINVFPNPSEDKIVIKNNETGAKNSVFYITDLGGSTIRSMKIQGKVTEWDIRTLPSGAYILWTDHQGSKLTWKIVKK